MIVQAQISAKDGGKYRLLVGGQVSGAVGVLQVSDDPMLDLPLSVGDKVVAVFFGTLADGIIIGKMGG